MANTAENHEVIEDSTAAAGHAGVPPSSSSGCNMENWMPCCVGWCCFAEQAVPDNAAETESLLKSEELDPEEEYNMKHKRRGLALIFNQVTFKDQELNRSGSDADCDILNKRLNHLGFEVMVFKNKKQEEVDQEIKKAAKADHSDADCFLLVFLSHGEDKQVHTYDGTINIKDITNKFRGTECRSLVGKPKIFIWQACRGNKHDDPATACALSNEETNDLEVDEVPVQTLPAGADFIMCYSTAEGYVSYRHKSEGSWYIQELCGLLQTYGETLEFTQLLTLVNRKVSKRSGDQNGKKQMPCFASMLTKKLHFHPKNR